MQAAITPRTKAIIPVHLYGQPADMRPIMELAARHALQVIEDAAQSHGAEYEDQRVGSSRNTSTAGTASASRLLPGTSKR